MEPERKELSHACHLVSRHGLLGQMSTESLQQMLSSQTFSVLISPLTPERLGRQRQTSWLS
jgi:hypothetical protein